MGTSKRHRKEKKKDFAKKKLKVGKTGQKKDNYTDTSFRAKSITLNQKRTLGGVSDESEQLRKKLSILRKPTQNLNSRKEIMTELLESLPKKYDAMGSDIEEVMKVSKILLLDRSKKIREMNRDMMKWLVEEGKLSLIELHLENYLLFINSGMTHLSPAVREDSIKALSILLSNRELSQLIVETNWYKLLKNYMILMNWNGNDGEGKMVVREDSTQLEHKNLGRKRVEELDVLQKLIREGCFESAEDAENVAPWMVNVQVHPSTKNYMISGKPNCYGSLKLWGTGFGDLDEASTDDVANRQKVLLEGFGKQLKEGLTELVKEEGKVGNIAKATLNDLESLE